MPKTINLTNVETIGDFTLADCDAKAFQKLARLKDPEVNIETLEISPEFTGRVAIDMLFSMGQSRERFATMDFIEGKAVFESFAVLKTNRYTPIRRASNALIALTPEDMDVSVLNSYQKQLIRANVSI